MKRIRQIFIRTLKWAIACSILIPSISTAQQQSITVGGVNRTMIVYAPANIAQNRPLVIACHGRGGDAPAHIQCCSFNPIADTAKFVVVYPNGINNGWDISGNTDINFISAIIDRMYEQYKIDKERVYLNGFSMGGMLTYHAATRIANKIAAFGSCSGYLLGGATFTSSRPIPLIHIHGGADDFVKYSGMQNIIDGWVKRNNITSAVQITKPYPVGKNNQNERKFYGLGDCETEVVFITLAGVGHSTVNNVNTFHSGNEIWKFCSRYNLSCGKISALKVTLKTTNDVYSYSAPAAINLSATPTSTNDPVSKVEFYNGSTKIGEDASAPYSYAWANVPTGTYTLTVVVTTASGKKSTSAAVSIKVNARQAPYGGTIWPIPGTIQLENFDVGGNGFAYNDATAGNTGGASFRMDEDVDVETCIDAGGGYNVGFATAGEWLEYSVNVTKTGVYDIETRVACNGTGRTVSLSMDGSALASNIDIPNTGGWQTWQTVKVGNVSLTSGQKIMRLTIGSADYVNLNYIEFKPTVSTGLDNEGTQGYSVIYPNPFFNEGLHVKQNGNFYYKILDAAGLLMESGTGTQEKIVGATLSAGVYFLSLETGNGVSVHKIVRR